MLGAEEPEMPDLRRAHIRGTNIDPFRRRAGEAGAQQVDRGWRGPRVVGEADRAQRAAIAREIRQRIERRVVEEIARLHHPAGPFEEYVARQVLADAEP